MLKKSGSLLVLCLAALLTLFWVPESNAQCEWCVQFKTHLCDDMYGCAPGSGCRTETFRVPCDGEYCISAATRCRRGDCSLVRSCITVFDDRGNVVMRAKSQCNPNECDWESCSGSARAFLSDRREYTIQVCMQPCEPMSCDDIEGCAAYGIIHNADHPVDCWPG